jgi:hypothetical protein
MKNVSDDEDGGNGNIKKMGDIEALGNGKGEKGKK